MIESFWLCFIPLLVAVDALGVLPMYMKITEGVDKERLKRVLTQSMWTALLVAYGFLFVGEAFLNALSVTAGDFMIAGGLLLLLISISDLLLGEKIQRKVDGDTLGVVPIGVPLIVGPAVLTTILLVSHQYGQAMTALSIAINIALAGLTFFFAPVIDRFVGKSGMKAISKIASLVLAAIGVRMIRRGVEVFLS
ncbi:MAG: MarC family protein [Candidatus Omnitrophica bacterium]|nr:MarC family protein [Candidatus Omnitrophota bacterium]